MLGPSPLAANDELPQLYTFVSECYTKTQIALIGMIMKYEPDR
jgi:hypothetical protein